MLVALSEYPRVLDRVGFVPLLRSRQMCTATLAFVNILLIWMIFSLAGLTWIVLSVQILFRSFRHSRRYCGGHISGMQTLPQPIFYRWVSAIHYTRPITRNQTKPILARSFTPSSHYGYPHLLPRLACSRLARVRSYADVFFFRPSSKIDPKASFGDIRGYYRFRGLSPA